MAPSAINVQEQYPAVLDSSHYGAIKLNGLDSRPNGGQAHGKELIRAALKKRVETINNETCEPGDEDSFYVADMGDVYRQHLKWKRKLGNIKPHYGKCRDYFGHTMANVVQLSNAITTPSFSVCSLSSERALTAPPRQRLTKFSAWASIRIASFMLNHARPSRISAMPRKLACDR